MLGTISGFAHHTILTRPLNHRALDPRVLADCPELKASSTEVIDAIGPAWDRARSLAGPPDLVGAAGSMYVVGEILRLMQTASE
jgi:folylpolyglutamate synthase/dihydropteroate synthase